MQYKDNKQNKKWTNRKEQNPFCKKKFLEQIEAQHKKLNSWISAK